MRRSNRRGGFRANVLTLNGLALRKAIRLLQARGLLGIRIKPNGLEMLEQRVMLSGSVTLSGSTLILVGAAGEPNTITAALNSSKTSIIATVDGASSTFARGSVSQIQVYGGNQGDTIKIDPSIALPASIDAGDGSDFISCDGGDSTVMGNGGNDTILGNGGNNEFHGGDGNDSIIGGTGASVLYGDDGNDTIIGQSGADTIGGGAGANVTQGAATDVIVNTTDSQAPPAAFTLAPLLAHIMPKSTDTIYAGMAVQVNGVTSGIGVGSPLTTNYEWDFGDPTGEYNDLAGWAAGHVYNTPGQYTITFTIVNQDGQTSTDTQAVTVLPTTSLRTIYVAPWGNDAGDGSSSKDPIESVARANQLLGSNTQLLFAAGGVYHLEDTLNVNGYENVEIGSWGTGAQPMLMYDGPGNVYTQIISTQLNSMNIAVNNLAFDSIYTGSNNEVSAAKLDGYNIAFSDCTFDHVLDGMDLSGAPIGLMALDDSAPNNELEAYFAYVAGADDVFLGNYISHSLTQHDIRVDGAKLILIAYNTMANVGGKSVLNIQYGRDAYIDNNIIDGPVTIGPLATTQSGVLSNFNATFSYTVFDANYLYNGSLSIQPGAYHTMIRNNVINATNAQAIDIVPYNELYARIVSDTQILGNTVYNTGTTGNFLKVVNVAQGTVLADNLYVAPNLVVGSYGTAPVYVGDTSLESFSLISHNIWSTAESSTGGVNYLWPYWWDPSGYVTPAAWDALAPVQGDIFESDTIDPVSYALSSNGLALTYGVAIPGLFADYQGNPRPAANLSVGAVQTASSSPVSVKINLKV